MKIGKKHYLIIFWTIVIAVLSLIPSSEIPSISLNSKVPVDKIAHIFLYAIYTLLIGKYLIDSSYNKGLRIMIVLTITISYGILMEVLQYYLSPSRFFDMLDIIANIIGSIVGLLLLKIKF